MCLSPESDLVIFVNVPHSWNQLPDADIVNSSSFISFITSYLMMSPLYVYLLHCFMCFQGKYIQPVPCVDKFNVKKVTIPMF